MSKESKDLQKTEVLYNYIQICGIFGLNSGIQFHLSKFAKDKLATKADWKKYLTTNNIISNGK